MSRQPQRPTARPEILISELPGEALIYEFASHRAHCVNAHAYRVFRLCDGTHTIEEMAELLSSAEAMVSTASVRQVLTELGAAGLLVEARRANLDHARRRVLKQHGRHRRGLGGPAHGVVHCRTHGRTSGEHHRVRHVRRQCHRRAVLRLGGGAAGTCNKGGSCSGGGPCKGLTCQ